MRIELGGGTHSLAAGVLGGWRVRVVRRGPPLLHTPERTSLLPHVQLTSLASPCAVLVQLN